MKEYYLEKNSIIFLMWILVLATSLSPTHVFIVIRFAHVIEHTGGGYERDIYWQRITERQVENRFIAIFSQQKTNNVDGKYYKNSQIHSQRLQRSI